MFKRIVNNTFVHVFIVSLVAVLTFLPTLQMFFYLDEFGSLYDFTHKDYQYNLFTTNNLYLLYKLFGIDPTGYFAVGTAIFVLSVVVLYFFVSVLLKNKVLGLIAGLVYATAPVGTSTVVMIWTFVIEGGYPLTVALLVLLYLLLRYFREGKIYYYLLALVGFTIFLELEPRRVFLFLPIIVLFDYLMHFKKIIIPDIKFFVRQAPFLACFVAYYKYTVTLSGILATGRITFNDLGNYDWHTKVLVAESSLSSIQPPTTLANILLGGPLVFLTEYANLVNVKYTYSWVAIILSIAAALVILAFRTKRELGLLMLFSLGWIYINILGIYIFSSPGISDITHRTLSLSAPAYALFITLSGFTLYKFLKKRKNNLSKKLNNIFVFALVFFLGVNFMSTRYKFDKFNNFRSIPARAFFKDLKRFYPILPANSIVYIQTSGNPQVKHRLGRIYGGNNYGAGSTLAIFYPELTLKEIDLVRDYTDIEKFVGNDPSKIDHVFAFYYDEKGLSDITTDTRAGLRK